MAGGVLPKKLEPRGPKTRPTPKRTKTGTKKKIKILERLLLFSILVLYVLLFLLNLIPNQHAEKAEECNDCPNAKTDEGK
jgi:hypothetical protein